MAFAAAAGTMSDGYVTAGEVARALVAVDKAEEQFDEAVRYLLQVLQAKLKVGYFFALEELMDSLITTVLRGPRERCARYDMLVCI